LLIGIAERSLWNLIRSGPPGAVGEAFNVAAALARGFGFADSYRVGQGPTAHLLPISPAIAGGLYAIFGINAWPAEFLLACWSIGLAMGTYLLLFRAFGRLGSARWARLIALAFGCMAPVYIAQESVDFRILEGGLSVFLCALFLDRLLSLQSSKTLLTYSIAQMAVLTALLFFVNPVLGLGAYACAGMTCLRRLRGVRLAGAISLAAVALAIFLTPWAIRNKIVMGEPILLRSNAGLELALANYPGALEARDRRDEYLHRILEIHPYASDKAYQAMLAAGGEVAYSQKLGAETWRWIAANPWAMARLALRHVRQIFAPEAWQFQLFGTGILTHLRAGLSSLAGCLGMLGLIYALHERRPNWIYPTILVMIPVIPLSIFQPVPRYIYLFYPMLVFCAADFVASIASHRRHDNAAL
jgi:hypothetical protein